MALSLTANASTLVGTWQGTYADTQPTNQSSGLVELLIQTQVPDGSVDTIGGYVDVICTSGPTGCGTGGYAPMTSATFNPTTSILSFVLGSSPSTTVTGTLSGDGNAIAGTYLASDDSQYGNWSVTEVAAVPLPAPLGLLGLGLVGVGLVARHKTSLLRRAAVT
jgi:hypothetical protein